MSAPSACAAGETDMRTNQWIKRALSAAALIWLGACASPGAQVLAINTLASPEPNQGSFDGLEARARVATGGEIAEINIVYFHGIGWTQRTTTLADDFASGLAHLYGVTASTPSADALCPSSASGAGTGGLRIGFSERQYFTTDVEGSPLHLTHVGCLDKRVVATPTVRYNIYRFFWDDYFWNGLEFAHVGYDDALYADAESSEPRPEQPVHERVAPLRQRFNSHLKDSLVTYGVSDAAMYMGPAGELIRQGASAAMCAALHDAASGNLDQMGVVDPSNGWRTLPVGDPCAHTPASVGAFALVSESLGSRVVFDVLRDARSAPDGSALRALIAQQPEVFMLANQLPLIGLGRLDAQRDGARASERPIAGRLVAISEVNDLLTFEVSPYVEQLWLTARAPGETAPRTRAALDAARRQRLARDFGFEVVDVRVRFAGPFLGLISSLADPDQAHLGHAEQPLLMRLMVCGTPKEQNVAPNSPCQ